MPSRFPRTGEPMRGCRVASIEILFSRNVGHAGTAEAVALLDDWKAKGAEGTPGTPAPYSAHWLAVHAVDSVAILIELAALWFWAADNPRSLPDDRRLSSALAHVTMRLAPVERRTSVRSGATRSIHWGGPAKRELGMFLRDTFAPFFVNVTNYFTRQRTASLSQVEALRAPF